MALSYDENPTSSVAHTTRSQLNFLLPTEDGGNEEEEEEEEEEERPATEPTSNHSFAQTSSGKAEQPFHF